MTKQSKDFGSKGCKLSMCKPIMGFLQGSILFLDGVSLLISVAEAGYADAVITASVGMSVLFPEAAPELLGGAIINDIATANAAGVIENNLGLVSLLATISNDALAGNTYLENGDMYLGKDTLFAATTTVAGFIPESNIDFYASAFQLQYDIDGTSGHGGGTINVSHFSISNYFSIFTNFFTLPRP